MNSAYRDLINTLGESRVEVNKPLKIYTSLKIGGPADLFFKAQNTKELVLALKSAKKNKVPVFLLGGGTNILVSDKGYRGLVIKNETGNIKLKGLTGRRLNPESKKNFVNKVYLEVDSGVTINRLVRNTIDQSLSGLEDFLGQPGTVGGAVWINAHNINMQSFFGDRVVSAKIYNSKSEIIDVNNAYFHFNYDFSIIQSTAEHILTVTLELESGNKGQLWESAKKVLEYRQTSQPQGVFTAGCLFKNIEKSAAMRLATPNYTCSAGFLLDSVGLKGVSVGLAKISDHHANFIINMGAATSSDMLELIDLARDRVKQKYGLDLELEVVRVGEFD